MRSDELAGAAGAAAERPPGDSKSERTRRRILDAAALVLRRKGYAGTRLSDIAKVAGMQAGSLYYHFSSREALVAEVMGTGVAVVQAQMQAALAALPPEASHRNRLAAAIEIHLIAVLEQSDYASATIKLLGQVPKDIQKQQLANERAYGKLWRQLLRDAREAGEIRGDLNLSAMRMMIVGALNWAVEWYHPEDGPAEQIARDFVEMVLHGLVPRR
ncbi:TetR family transcriptional regulator [Marinibaculum pumilum]|uniref:TetR family transcriptional regulator n=1 Tax=Marinibaculum pumilum TaxID=1766165 RepID=A0ABV7L624_9PROT